MKITRIFEKIYIKVISNQRYINYLRKKGVIIGNSCDINKNCVFGTEPYLIEIGDFVRLSSNVQFITHDGGLWVLRNMGVISPNMDKFGKITIGNNVNIGWNVVILPNVRIGNNVIIGAGSIVTKDIPDNCVYAGVPAKFIESIEKYFEKNKNKMIASKYLNSYDKKNMIENFFNKDGD